MNETGIREQIISLLPKSTQFDRWLLEQADNWGWTVLSMYDWYDVLFGRPPSDELTSSTIRSFEQDATS